MSLYNKGSEWRKWDLHVHTPFTKLSDNFKVTRGTDDEIWDLFCQKIHNSDVDVFAMTDYFSADNYFTFIQKYKYKYPKSKKIFFPNIEFRLNVSVNSRAEEVHMHVIFNDSVSNERLNSFLTKLDTSISKNGGKISCAMLETSDFEKASVSYDNIKTTLKEVFGKERCYLILAAANNSGIRPDTSSPRKLNITDEIDKVCDGFFGGLQNVEYYLRTNRYETDEIADKKPVIAGSDAHSFDDLDNWLGKQVRKNGTEQIEKNITWIKADPTFEGLKQIIYEPEERIFIGKKPPILDKVQDNPTKYLKLLEINQNKQNTSTDSWFKDISIPFNKELVAIIGNKGSGKSALADILGLVGRAHIDKKYFSFLHEDKFWREGLAGKFYAKAIWEGGNDSEKLQLNEENKGQVPEAVRFIPQSYFEDLTNEIEILNFQKILEKIIYKYIPDEEKSEIPSFEELVIERTKVIKLKINEQKNKIQKINDDIIRLEKKDSQKYRIENKEFIKQKGSEIEAQEVLLAKCPEIANPEEDQRVKIVTESILECNNKLSTLKKTLQEKQALQASIITKINSLKSLAESTREQEEQVKDFIKNNRGKYEEIGLKIDEILKVETDYTSVETLLKAYKEEQTNNDIYLVKVADSVEENPLAEEVKSILYKIDALKKTIESKRSQLTEKGQEFQENEQRKIKIKETISILKGGDKGEKPETLNYYKKEKEYLDNRLQGELRAKRKGRVKISLEIFKAKNEIIAVYNNLKANVDQTINKNSELLDGYDIKIDSSFNLDVDFHNSFLGYINQSKAGCFYGKEKGVEKIKTIIVESGFDTEDKIKVLLETIIVTLEEGDAEISDQVNEEKLLNFYNYVFSLEYIEAKYELKSEGKTLLQLSPGERGALLLVFYLMIDKEDIPLIIDQPEDNLDNESVYNILSKFIKKAKKRRQIIMVTHNPNLAVGADAEQIIYVSIDKTQKNKFSFISGSIENPVINKKIVQILEGTKPAFDKRKLKYQINNKD